MRNILRPLAILLIKFLQIRYRIINEKNEYNQSNQVLARLMLIQSILYYFKQQFRAWGYFHPDCGWSKIDEKRFRKLFPFKDHYEIDLVTHYNPEAVTYYKNKIYKLTKGASPCYEKEIRKQLIEWKDWN